MSKNYILHQMDIGLGGLDVFVSKINSDSFNEVQNLGSDINSQRTILHIIDTKSRMGFLALIVMVVKDMMIFINFRN
jgi:hypothetical protein